MENKLIESLPQEVAQIAENVSVEKRTEVQSVLNKVFDGVSKMREQLQTVVVADENDKTNMKIANTIRLGVRQVRLDAEKTFDAKRAEVQQQMLSYKTEDSLWLKAKQTMQILTKEIEENARWKEETRDRIERERKELKIQQRMIQVSKVAPEMPSVEFENMSDETFAIFYAGIEKQHNDKIEAEKKAEEERVAIQKAEEQERERIRVENERLKAEADEKERQFDLERARVEAEKKALEEKVRKEKEQFDRIAAEEKAKQDAILRAEREAREKLEAELKAKADAEEKARREEELKSAKELREKQAADKKAKAAPDKIKLEAFATQIEALAFPDLKSQEAKDILSDTKNLLLKVSKYIRDKTAAI